MWFTRAEFQERLDRLVTHMAQRSVDVLVVDETEHLAYLIGYSPSAATYQACLVSQSGDVVAVVRELDEPTFLGQSWVRDYVTFRDWDDPIKRLARLIDERGWGRAKLGMELDSHFLLVQRYNALREELRDAEILDFSGVLWEMRLRKSEQELAYHQRAASIADTAFARGVAVAAPGVTERHVMAEVYRIAIENGADNTRIALGGGGHRTTHLHGNLGGHIFGRRDRMHLELVPHYKRYTSRVMRPIAIGPPEKDVVEATRTLVELQDAQFDEMRPGTSAGKIDRQCREQLVGLGLVEQYPNTTGYTLGCVTVPRTSDFTRIFVPTADWSLEEGMVFHMYLSAQRVSISETVVVTPAGVRRLSRLPRRILEAGELLETPTDFVS